VPWLDTNVLEDHDASIYTSEMLVSNYHTTWCNNPQNYKLYLHCHENFKSCIRGKAVLCVLLASALSIPTILSSIGNIRFINKCFAKGFSQQ
jgi:hypothetical protein